MKFLNYLSVLIFLLLAKDVAAQTITVTSLQELEFGSFFASDNIGGTVAISNNGAWTSSGNFQLINSYPHHAAIFRISTESVSDVKVEVESYAVNLTKPDGTTLFLTANLPDSAVYTVSYLAPVEVSIGGSLDISSEAGSSPGNYVGNVSIKVTVVP